MTILLFIALGVTGIVSLYVFLLMLREVDIYRLPENWNFHEAKTKE